MCQSESVRCLFLLRPGLCHRRISQRQIWRQSRTPYTHSNDAECITRLVIAPNLRPPNLAVAAGCGGTPSSESESMRIPPPAEAPMAGTADAFDFSAEPPVLAFFSCIQMKAHLELSLLANNAQGCNPVSIDGLQPWFVRLAFPLCSRNIQTMWRLSAEGHTQDCFIS